MPDWNHFTPTVSPASYASAMIPLRVEGADPTNPALDTFQQIPVAALVAASAALTTYEAAVAAPTGASLIGFAQSVAYVAGTAGAKLQQTINPMDAPYNAAGNGTTDDYTAFAAADAAAAALGMPLTITKLHKIGTAYTLKSILVSAGGIIKPASGVTFTLGAGINAAPVQVFDISLGGAIAFTASPAIGYAEWFGAVPNNAGFAAQNLLAINTAVATLATVQLLAADYWTSGTVIHATEGHTLAGAGSYYNSTPNMATRILLANGSATIIQVGASVNPGTPNAMPTGIKVRDMFITRTVAPVIASACDGLVLQYALGAEVRNVFSQDSMNSFHVTGAVACHVIDSHATRVTAGTGGGTDSWNGYYLDGSNSIGAAGGNASIYLVRNQAGCNIAALQAAGSNGYYLFADNFGTQDTFLSYNESVSCSIGTLVDNGSAGGQGDVRIVHQTDDQCAKYGLLIAQLNSDGAVDISDYYCGASATAQFGIYVNLCVGSISIRGGQLLVAASPTIQAIAIANSVGVSVRGTQIIENGGSAAVVLSASSNCVIEPQIHNITQSTTGAAVQLAGACSGNRVAPLVYGPAGRFGFGIQVVGTADLRNEYALTGIDSACITGGYANKLTRNGATAITSATMLPAYVGTNLLTGCAG